MELAADMYHFISIELFLIILKWELAYFAIFQFTGLLAVCRTCFMALENRLKNRLRGYSKWEAVEKSDQLIKCCETINSCYGSMLLIMLISFFGLITTNLYAAYLKSNYKWTVFICVLSAFILLTTFHYLVEACTKTAETVNKFNRYIRNSIIQDILTECAENQNSEDMAVGDENDTSRKDGNPKPNATFKKIMFQSTLTMEVVNRKDMEFTANGYFSINYSLFYSMIETSATYLIICIQSYTIEFISETKPSFENSTGFFNDGTDFQNDSFLA
ncbi:uncharacterized protein [Rhodnius prolixus]|uniref:uncharacterized protein n=1 Tax=Rhodnius prolixus TaxID=13249 RepID=UPI003D18C5B5